jgi:hypothetical protein
MYHFGTLQNSVKYYQFHLGVFSVMNALVDYYVRYVAYMRDVP